MNKTSSFIIDECQISKSKNLKSVLFLGYFPPVNSNLPIGNQPKESKMFPLELLYCPDSFLAQISCEVSPSILFPPEYPYTSGTTKILRNNFYNLCESCKEISTLENKFIIDIGSNDGTLLSNFKNAGCKVLGIDPTDKVKIANSNGINSIQEFFNHKTAKKVHKEFGKADIITAANVFAHMKDIYDVMDGILELMKDSSIFISENHYLLDLINTFQYDTIYHEHLRYYSLHSLEILFKKYDLEIFKVDSIPTHGGSIRVYTSKKGQNSIHSSVKLFKEKEIKAGLLQEETYKKFAEEVMLSKLKLLKFLEDIKSNGKKIVGVGAPSRASTLLTYVGIDHHILDSVMEIKGSYKIGSYMPGSLIPIIDERNLYENQPDYALLLSWHISDELIYNLRKNGFKGKFIVPLPDPKIIE